MLSPNHESILRGRSWIEAAKNQLKKKVLPRFAKTIQKALEGTIDSTEFVLPMEKEVADRYFRDSLILLRDTLRQKLEADEHLSQGSLEVISTLVYNQESLSTFYAEVNSFCHERYGYGKYLLITDHFQTSTGKISLGWQALESAQLGKGLILHELGHSLSQQITKSTEGKEEFQKVRDCLDLKYQKDKKNYRAGFYLEEDWADLIAAEAGNSEDGNYFCTMPGEWLSFINPNPNDPHSSSLFRLLHIEHIRSGRLPNECQETLQSLETQPDFSSCFL